MMRFKQDLVAAHGVERGFEAFRQRLNLAPGARVREVVVESDRTYAEGKGAFFAETAPAGGKFVNVPPPVTGAGNHRPISGITRSQYVACLHDVCVQGRSALIHSGSQVLLDVQREEEDLLDDELEWDPALFHADGRRGWRIECARVEPPFEVDEAFNLLGAHSDFFGHWMCEYLPKYVAAKMSGYLPETPILIDAHMPAAHRGSLELLYGLSVPVIEVPAFREVHVRKLWCAPSLSYLPLHEVRNERFSWDAISASGSRFVPVIEDMQRRLDRHAVLSSAATPNIYLARKAFRHRRMVNSDEIEQAARDQGFEVVYPEDMPFAEQAALVRGARIIAAPEGSAVFLSIFGRRGTSLVLLSHPLTELFADYNALLSPHEIDVRVLTGPIVRANTTSPNDSDYEIDPGTFRSMVSGL